MIMYNIGVALTAKMRIVIKMFTSIEMCLVDQLNGKSFISPTPRQNNITCLMGDFNCRAGNLHEYTQEENDDILDMSNINNFHHTIDDIIDNNQIVHKARVTIDTTVNEYGKELINIC